MAVMNQLPQQQRTVLIHKSTTNQSFLDMHYYLKNKGIQNNDFFLALLDSGLAGVDPRDPNLQTHMKARILQECRLNYWYYLREVVRIPVQGGTVGSGARYKLHRGNLAMNFLFILNFNMFVEMPRQHGKTIAAVCRYLWIYNFGTSNSEIMFMHKDHSGSKGNLKTLKNIRDALPSYLQMSSNIDINGNKLKVPNTVVMIQHPFNNNKINTYPSARTKDAANNLGRGATIPVQYYDEFAFMPWNEEVFMAAVPAFSKASENARQNNAPYGMLITTTPGDLLTNSGIYAYEIRNKATPWKEEYYDMSYQELIGLRDSNNQSNMFLVSYTYQQLGSGQDYFKRMVVEMQSNWAKIRREVMLEWAETATDCPFAQEDLDIIKLHIKEPIRTIFFGKFRQYQFNIYEDLDLSYPPIIGVDVAGATFNDSSAITVIDSRTTRVCATLNCNFIPADDLAQVIYELVTKYMPNAIINIERNGGFGSAVIQRLVKTSVKKNLYWEIKDRVVEESYNGTRVQKQNRKVKVYGLDSTKSVRARLVEILMERAMYHKDKFVAPIILEEMRAMQVKKNGKVEHSDRSHDDQVFSYLMALYVWYDGHNLIENFGIRKSTIKTDTDEDIESVEIEDALEAREKIDFNGSTFEVKEEIAAELEWIEKDSRFITSDDLAASQFIGKIEARNILIANDKGAAASLEMDTGINVVNLGYAVNQQLTTLPNSLFLNDTDFDDENEGYHPEHEYLQGNLSKFYDML